MSDSVGTRTPVAGTGSTPVPAPAGTRPPGAGRLLWADCAKGLSIIAVCYMHVVTGVPGGQDSAWHWFNTVMDPLRMPMFFLISGLFSHRVITRTLGDLWYRRLWFLLVPYLVFTPVQAAIRLDMTDDVSWASMARAILFGDPGIWFLYALMIFNIAACLLRRVPAGVAVGLSVVPALVVCATGLTGYNEITHITAYMPAFFLGLHFRHVYLRLSALARDWRVIGAVVALYVVWEVVMDLPQDATGPGPHSTLQEAALQLGGMARVLTAVPAGIVLAAWLASVPVVSTVLAAIGRNTLPVYVSHHAALYLVNAVLLRNLVESDPDRWAFLTGMNAQILLGIVTCVASGFLFYAVGKTPVLRWVLYPPALPGHPKKAR